MKFRENLTEANVPIIKNYELINKIGGAGNVANNINKIDKIVYSDFIE